MLHCGVRHNSTKAQVSAAHARGGWRAAVLYGCLRGSAHMHAYSLHPCVCACTCYVNEWASGGGSEGGAGEAKAVKAKSAAIEVKRKHEERRGFVTDDEKERISRSCSARNER